MNLNGGLETRLPFIYCCTMPAVKEVKLPWPGVQQPAQVYPTWDIPGVSYPNLSTYTGYLYICSFCQLVMSPFSAWGLCCSLHLVTACLHADGLAFLARRTAHAGFHTLPFCLLFLAVKEYACWGREMCLEKGVLIRLQESWEQTSNIIG